MFALRDRGVEYHYFLKIFLIFPRISIVCSIGLGRQKDFLVALSSEEQKGQSLGIRTVVQPVFLVVLYSHLGQV